MEARAAHPGARVPCGACAALVDRSHSPRTRHVSYATSHLRCLSSHTKTRTQNTHTALARSVARCSHPAGMPPHDLLSGRAARRQPPPSPHVHQAQAGPPPRLTPCMHAELTPSSRRADPVTPGPGGGTTGPDFAGGAAQWPLASIGRLSQLLLGVSAGMETVAFIP